MNPDANRVVESPNGAVLAFFGLTFAVSWVAGIVVAAVLQAALPDSLDRLSLLVAKFGPSIAGVVMAYVVSGRPGLLSLLRATGRLRAHVGWYALVLLGPAVMWAVALFAYDVTGGAVDWTFVDAIGAGDIALALATFTFLGGGLGEELGWRGFALPMLQRRMGALAASAVIGSVWAIWHYPALLLDPEQGAILPFTSFVLAATVLLTWMFNTTRGNVLLAVLFHAAFNATESLVEGAVAKRDESQAELWLIGLYALAALVIIVVYPVSTLAPRDRTAWPDNANLQLKHRARQVERSSL